MSRDGSLPSGVSDLIDLVRLEQKNRRDMEVYLQALENECSRLAPIVFLRLYRLIDHDLLFTSETDLLQPKVREVSCLILREASVDIPIADSRFEWMVDVLTEKVLLYIRNRPGRRLTPPSAGQSHVLPAADASERGRNISDRPPQGH